MTLLQASPESEARILSRIGAILVLCIVVAAAFYFVVNPFGTKPRDVISVAIETPYVGQGVAPGTPMMMHGVQVGQVVSVSSIPGRGVRLEADFQAEPTRGLTDAMGIDYRPANYFGITGINVIPAQHGRPLKSGMQIKITPKGNFSLQALIYRLGELSNGVFNQRLVDVVERATRYVDGLNPLLETALMVATSVSKVQTVSTERLLRNATGVSVAFPGFVETLTGTGNAFLQTRYYRGFDIDEFKKTYKYYSVLTDEQRLSMERAAQLFRETAGSEDYYNKKEIPGFNFTRDNLFGKVGYLEGSHINDLFPIIESVRTLADAVPKIVSPENFAYTLTQIRERFERMYAGSGDQRALQVRIILDRLPGVATPLGLLMAGPS